MDVEAVGEKLGTKRQWLKEFLSEFTGTLILVFAGSCCQAQKMLGVEHNRQRTNALFSADCCEERRIISALGFGDPTAALVGYAFAVLLAVLVSGPSGSNLNPAVTLSFCVIGKKPWKDCLHYFLGQYLGCFVGAALAYIVYLDGLHYLQMSQANHIGVVYDTASIFVTAPANYITVVGAFVNEVMATFVLLLVLCAIIDENNWGVTPALIPLYVGILLLTLFFGFSANTGCAVNPARDFGPRIFIAIAGWGSEAFGNSDYWWIPIVGPHLGGILGALFYVFFIEIHHGKGQE